MYVGSNKEVYIPNLKMKIQDVSHLCLGRLGNCDAEYG